MLKIENLRLVYPDGTCAVEDLSLTLSEGESVALVGANGAGKTSLFLSLVGVLPIHSGTVTAGETILSKKTVNEIRRKIGLVFQNPDDQLFMPLVRDDVAFGPRNYGKSPAEVETIVAETLERLGISHLAEKSTTKMSGGEKRMAAIATVLAMDPQIMLLDEPTAFLDPKARRNLIRILNGLPHTKLIATHDLTFACEACSRVVVLADGRIAADGKPDQILYDRELMDRCGIEAIGYMEK